MADAINTGNSNFSGKKQLGLNLIDPGGIGALGVKYLTPSKAKEKGNLLSDEERKARNQAADVQSETERVTKDAEQKALNDAETERKQKTQRASILAKPTSGYGANTNLARSFLTSL